MFGAKIEFVQVTPLRRSPTCKLVTRNRLEGGKDFGIYPSFNHVGVPHSLETTASKPRCHQEVVRPDTASRSSSNLRDVKLSWVHHEHPRAIAARGYPGRGEDSFVNE